MLQDSWCIHVKRFFSFLELQVNLRVHVLISHNIVKISLWKPIALYWFKNLLLELFSLHLVSSFFLKKMRFYKDIFSTWISRTSAELFFLTDWRHTRRKNTIEISSIYENLRLGFFKLKWLYAEAFEIMCNIILLPAFYQNLICAKVWKYDLSLRIREIEIQLAPLWKFIKFLL